MIKPQFNEDQNVWEIDVPGDNICLLWAVTLAYLIPVKDNDYFFEKRLKKLLGKVSSEQLGLVKNWIRTTYNPFLENEATHHNDILTTLVRENFPHRIVNHMNNPQYRGRFKDHVPINECSLDAHLNKMKDSNTWGGEIEIRAISELLDCRIQVISAGQEHSYGYGTLIQLFHVEALANSPEANHYHFGLEKDLGDRYQSTSEEPPHSKASYDVEANRAVVQKESQQQLKQPDTKKESFNINVSLVKGSSNEVYAQNIKVIGIQNNYNGQQDPYTAYFGEVEIYGIDFKKDVIELRPFLEGQNQILHLSFTGKDTLLGYITVGILFKKIKEKINHKEKKTEVNNYTKGNSLRVASLDWLLQKDEVLNDFKKIGQNNLLVVACTAHHGQHQAEEKFRNLFGILKGSPEKKAIFIAIEDREQNGVSSFIRNFSKKMLGERYTEKAGDEIKFSDLTNESEYKVLNKEVLFQGHQMQLSRLMGVKDPDNLSQEELDKLDKILDAAALLELITNTGITIGSAPPSWQDQDTFLDEETYVPRSFSRKIPYANKALTKNAGDLFVVSDKEEEDFKNLTPEKEHIQLFDPHNPNIDPHKRFILLDSRTRNCQDQEEAFNKLCSFIEGHHKDKVIHWLKKEEEEMVWQRTWFQSQTYVYGTDASEKASARPAPSETTQPPDKIVVVIDEPGMGKSTTLTHVSEEARKADKWVIRINLKEHQESIEKQLVQDDQSLLALLAAIDTQGLKATLARRLLAYRLQQQYKIVLLLDGFDEISSNCQDKVLQLLQFIKNEHRAEKLWITARLHTKTKLEDALSVFSYSFQPFNTEDQQRFLNRFWTKRLTGEGESVEGAAHEDCLAYYGGELINRFSSPKGTSLKTKTLGEVIGIPLLTSMLAEIFFNDLKNYYDHNKGKNNTEFALGSDSKLRTLNILELYEEFIKTKFEIYFKEKISIETKINPGTKQLLIDGYAKEHRFLAFGTLFYEQIERFLGVRKVQFSNNELAAIGMIKDFKSHAPHFIHPTFAEYFIADLLYMRLSKDKDNPTRYANVTRFLQEHLFEARNDMIRLFLDYNLTKGLSMHMAVLHGEENESDALLQKDAECVSQVDSLGRIPLHLAAAYGYNTIIEELINKKGSIGAADALGEYPLGYAVLSGDEEVFRLILRKGSFPGNQTEASTKILLATMQMLVQRWEKGMLKLILSYAYVHRSQVAVMVSANNYSAFQTAVKKGDYNQQGMIELHARDGWSDSSMVDLLLSKASDEQQQGMLRTNNYGLFQEAVKRGDSSMVEFLWSKASDEHQRGMLSADNYGAFKKAVQWGNSSIVDRLWSKASDEQQEAMFKSLDYIREFQSAIQKSDSTMADLLLSKASGEQQQRMLSANDYGAFQVAVQSGFSNMVNILLSKASGEHKRAMIRANNYGAFQEAVKRGDSSMVEFLWSKASNEHQQGMLIANNYGAFQQAVQSGDSSMIEFLWSKASGEQQQAMFTSVDYIRTFQTAVKIGDYKSSQMVKFLLSNASGEQQQGMLSANNYGAFQQAVKRGDSCMVEVLLSIASNEHQQGMLSANNYGAFQQTVQSGDSWMVERLWSKASGEQQKGMLRANNYGAFQKAVQRGDSRMVERLWSKASGEQQQGMLRANNYGPFQEALQRGDSSMVDSLWSKASGEQQQAMFTSVDYIGAFQSAKQKSDSTMVDLLLSKASGEQQQRMLSANDYGAFQVAVQSGNSNMVECLWSKASVEQKPRMLSANNYGAFQEAVHRNDTSMVERLLSKASGEQQQRMLSVNDYGAFQVAVQSGYSNMVECLWSKASVEQKPRMLSANNYCAFQEVVQSGDSSMVERLWSKAFGEHQQAMFTSVDYTGAFQSAVKRCDSSMVDSLWSKAIVEQKRRMLSANNYGAFQEAVQSGYSNMVECLWSKASGEQQQRMLSANNYGAFQEAVQSCDSSMVESLWSKASCEHQQAMFTCVDYTGAFQSAVKRCDSSMLHSLWSKASGQQQQIMFTSVDYIGAFQSAIQRSDFRMVERLWSNVSDEQQQSMLSANNYGAFQHAVQKGDSSMVEWLWSKASVEQKARMLSANNYGAFQQAVKNWDFPIVDNLWSKASGAKQQAMFTSVDYISAFQTGVKMGDYKGSKIVKFLLSNASGEQQQGMLSANNYGAFQQAVKRGDSSMVERLWSKASVEQKSRMLSANNYSAFQEAVQRGDSSMLELLWSKASGEQETWMLNANNYGPFQNAIQTGDSRMVEFLWSKASGEQQQALFKSIDYIGAFQSAVKRGDSSMVDSLWSKASGEQQQAMFKSIDYIGAFQSAVKRGDSSMVDSLWYKASGEQQQTMFKSLDYIGVFQSIVQTGYSLMVDILWTKASGEQQQEMFTSVDYTGTFQEAIQRGDFWMVDILWKVASREQQQIMLSADNYGAFQKAVQRGNFSIINILLSNASNEQQQVMLSANNYGAFQKAVQLGYSSMVNLLLSKASPEQQKGMLSAYNYGAFQQAVKRGYCSMVDLLLSKASDEQEQRMLSANNYDAFQQAVKRGDSSMVERLWSRVSVEQKPRMLSANNYGAFQEAVHRGDSSMVERLWSKASGEQQQAMFTSVDYISAFQTAVKLGDYKSSQMVKFLLSKASSEQQKGMVSAYNYGAFQVAVKRGDSSMVEFLWSKASNELQQGMLFANNYGAFQEAVQRGDSSMVEFLWSKASGEQQQAMFTSVDYISAFQTAVKMGDCKGSKMVKFLLSNASGEQQQVLLSANNYGAYQEAVQRGDS